MFYSSIAKRINEDCFLVSYLPEINKKSCKTLNLDLSKVRGFLVKDLLEDVKVSYPSVSVAISAAVTAYGRIHMCKVKKDILEKGGQIYYSDTDSIVTDMKLEECCPEMVDSSNKQEIGKLKKEYTIVKGYFISGKTYCLILDKVGVISSPTFYVEFKDSVIKKIKGMKSFSITVDDFIKMLNGESIDTAIKSIGLKDYSDGSVTIKEENVTLNKEGYTRREKVYRNNK